MQAWIGLGANLQKPVAQLQTAIRKIDQLAKTRVTASSSFYRTPPWGEKQQDDFINAVICIDTGLEPLALLSQLQSIETSIGRIREGRRWGPRLIDIDILLYEQRQIEHDRLTVPHLHMHERAFVLVPLLELDSDIEIPGVGRADILLEGLDCDEIARLDGA